MDVAGLLNELGSAVADAKAKADYVANQKADLAALVAGRQADIDKAQQEYADAKIAVDRLQEQVRAVMGELLPAPDPRFRSSV